jgi:hypothetical protein
VWRLISSWDRNDGSVTWFSSSEPRMRRWVRHQRRRLALFRADRKRRRRTPTGPGTSGRVVAALGPTIERHGISPAHPQQGDDTVWCSPAAAVGAVGQDDEYRGDPRACTDLWVYVDPAAQTIAVDLEGHGLAEFVTGRRHWDGPIAIDLADDLDASLEIVAGHVDRLCDAVIVRD